MSEHLSQATARPGPQNAVINTSSNLVPWPTWTIISPGHLIHLLRRAKPKAVLPMALTAFAGLRVAEVISLHSGDIRLDDRQIRVRARPAARTVSICDTLAVWLESKRDHEGPVVHGIDLQAELRRLGNAIGVSDLARVLHASFCAYRAALTRDWIQVGGESGYNSLLLRLCCPAPIPIADAKTWFRVLPDSLRA